MLLSLNLKHQYMGRIIGMRVLILGYGEMGHALQFLLAGRQDVVIWSRSGSVSLEQEAPMANIILFCLPVVAHQEVLNKIKPFLAADSLCLSIAKGLDEAGKSAFVLFAESLGSKQEYGVIYGPMISEDIRRDRYAFADVALSNPDAFARVEHLFAGSKLACRYSDDMPGITWSVILKNVYAILFGIADGLQLGDNLRGHLAVTALAELAAIVQSMGGKATSPYGYAGLGDLITTATSIDSHHHELGRQLALGQAQDISGEGVHTLHMVEKYQPFNYRQHALFELARAILADPAILPAHMEQYLRQTRH